MCVPFSSCVCLSLPFARILCRSFTLYDLMEEGHEGPVRTDDGESGNDQTNWRIALLWIMRIKIVLISGNLSGRIITVTNGQNSNFFSLFRVAHESANRTLKSILVMVEWDSSKFACRIKSERQGKRANWLAINLFTFLSHLHPSLSLSSSIAGMWLHHCVARIASAQRSWWRYYSGSDTSIQCWTHWSMPISIVISGRRSKTPWNACSSIAGARRHRTAHTTYNKLRF